MISECCHKSFSFSGKVVLEKKLLKPNEHFSVILNYLPFEENVFLCFNKLEFPFPKDALCRF